MLQMKYVWLFVATSALIDVIASLVFIAAPSAGTVRGYIVNEDSLIENLTAGLFLCTFLFALVLLNTRRITNKLNFKWLILLLALGLIGFLDEISFGERLLGLEMPVLGATKIDAVHDIFELGISLTPRLASDQQLIILLVLFGGLVLSIVAILKYGKRIRNAAIADRFYPLYLVILFFVLLVCSALMLDTGRFPFTGHKAVEECLELNAAMALLTCCFIIYKLEMNKSSP